MLALLHLLGALVALVTPLLFVFDSPSLWPSTFPILDSFPRFPALPGAVSSSLSHLLPGFSASPVSSDPLPAGTSSDESSLLSSLSEVVNTSYSYDETSVFQSLSLDDKFSDGNVYSVVHFPVFNHGCLTDAGDDLSATASPPAVGSFDSLVLYSSAGFSVGLYHPLISVASDTEVHSLGDELSSRIAVGPPVGSSADIFRFIAWIANYISFLESVFPDSEFSAICVVYTAEISSEVYYHVACLIYSSSFSNFGPSSAISSNAVALPSSEPSVDYFYGSILCVVHYTQSTDVGPSESFALAPAAELSIVTYNPIRDNSASTYFSTPLTLPVGDADDFGSNGSNLSVAANVSSSDSELTYYISYAVVGGSLDSFSPVTSVCNGSALASMSNWVRTVIDKATPYVSSASASMTSLSLFIPSVDELVNIIATDDYPHVHPNTHWYLLDPFPPLRIFPTLCYRGLRLLLSPRRFLFRSIRPLQVSNVIHDCCRDCCDRLPVRPALSLSSLLGRSTLLALKTCGFTSWKGLRFINLVQS